MRIPNIYVLFHVLSALVVLTQAGSLTVDFTNPAVLLSPDWTIPPSSQIPPSGNPPFASTTAIGAFLSLNFPNGTFAAQYVGFARAGGSSYGVCLDCIGDQGTFQVIDGHDGSLNSDDDATSTILFSLLDLDPTAPHTLSVYNLPDDRFNKSGAITFQSIIFNTTDSGDASDDSNGVSVGDSNGNSTSSDGGDNAGGSNGNNSTNAGDGGDNDGSAGDNSGNNVSNGSNLAPGGGNSTESGGTNSTDSSASNSTSADNSPTSDQPESTTSLSPEAVTHAVARPTPVASPTGPDSSQETGGPNPDTSGSDPESTSSGANAETTNSPAEPSSTPASSALPKPSPTPVGKTATNQSESAAALSTARRSNTLIIVISVLSALAVLAVIIGVLLFFFLRRRRQAQKGARLPDPEDDPNNKPRSPLRSSPTIRPTINMREKNGPGGGVPPERPRNPFEDEPLDGNLGLEYPADSTLMKKRDRRMKRGSSFGNRI